nr:hypothetical protein [Propionibacterium sp.]
MTDFDDSRLDDPEALRAGDAVLRPLAEAGARLRREAANAEPALAGLGNEGRPRAVIAVGPEARLLRAVLEPSCPVPFVAWSNLGLPGWVGPLDVVIVLGGSGIKPFDCVHEALRRGSRVILTARPGTDLANRAESRLTTLLPSTTTDPLCRAIAALMALHALGLAPYVDPQAIADRMDAVAAECAHSRDIAANPAKMLALELADAQPLIWGGSVLAARASRRIAEAVRSASGRVALAADASELVPLLAETRPRDLFSDPFEDQGSDRRPSLVIVEDGLGDAAADEERDLLEKRARLADVRVSRLEHAADSELVRYATVLQKGRFAAAYLGIAMGRPPGS